MAEPAAGHLPEGDAAGGDDRPDGERRLVPHAAGRVLVDDPAPQGRAQLERLAGADHRVGQRVGLAPGEPLEVDGHAPRGHLVVGNVAAREAEDELGDLLVRELARPLRLRSIRSAARITWPSTEERLLVEMRPPMGARRRAGTPRRDYAADGAERRIADDHADEGPPNDAARPRADESQRRKPPISAAKLAHCRHRHARTTRRPPYSRDRRAARRSRRSRPDDHERVTRSRTKPQRRARRVTGDEIARVSPTTKTQRTEPRRDERTFETRPQVVFSGARAPAVRLG